MKNRRRAALAGVAVLGAVALSGCSIDKPTPLVTLVAGSDSVHSEAECHDSKEIPLEKLRECMARDNFTTISAVRGSTFGIGVEGKIAEHGWTVWVNGEPIDARFMDTTFVSKFTVPYASESGDDGSLKVHVLEQENEDAPIKGVWAFKVDTRNP